MGNRYYYERGDTYDEDDGYTDEELQEIGRLMLDLPRGVVVKHTRLLGWGAEIFHDKHWFAVGGYENDLLRTLRELTERLETGTIKLQEQTP
jgi:hypothetical protein